MASGSGRNASVILSLSASAGASKEDHNEDEREDGEEAHGGHLSSLDRRHREAWLRMQNWRAGRNAAAAAAAASAGGQGRDGEGNDDGEFLPEAAALSAAPAQQRERRQPASGCSARRPGAVLPGMDDWCRRNCAEAHCPPRLCVCP